MTFCINPQGSIAPAPTCRKKICVCEISGSEFETDDSDTKPYIQGYIDAGDESLSILSDLRKTLEDTMTAIKITQAKLADHINGDNE